jgi:hypothetical protein
MHASRYQIVVPGRLGVDALLTGDPNRSGRLDVLNRLRRDLALDLIGLTGLAPGPDIRQAQ